MPETSHTFACRETRAAHQAALQDFQAAQKAHDAAHRNPNTSPQRLRWHVKQHDALLATLTETDDMHMAEAWGCHKLAEVLSRG